MESSVDWDLIIGRILSFVRRNKGKLHKSRCIAYTFINNNHISLIAVTGTGRNDLMTTGLQPVNKNPQTYHIFTYLCLIDIK